MKIEKKVNIKASLLKTYEVAETYPLFVKPFREKKILWNTEAGSKVRITNIFFGIPLTWEGESKKKKNEFIAWIQTSGLLKGLRATWLFNAIDHEQTEVIIQGEYTASGPRGLILNPLAPILIGKATSKILGYLKTTAEC